MDQPLDSLTKKLAKLATHYDLNGAWPEKSLFHLLAESAWTWAIPREYGGSGLDPFSMVRAYEAVAAGCMTTLLILTQRDGACELIAEGDNEALREELLPKLASYQLFATVGISQITTSHQGGRAALTAKPDGDAFRLQGFMPWVTAAVKSQYIVTGAALPDGRQILAAVSTDLPGITIDPPMQLMVLQGSHTSEVHCKNVLVEPRFILRGPMEKVLASRSTVKPMVVAASGLGLAGAMMRLVQHYAAKAGTALAEMAEELDARYQGVRQRVHKYASSLDRPAEEIPKTELRVAVNDLLMRLAVGVFTFSKGSGLVRQMDAQRLVREAMFFLVWSAPEDVRTGTLASFLHQPEPSSRSMAFK